MVFLIALLARTGVGTYRMVVADDPAALEFPDEQQYWGIARCLADGQGMRDELGFRASRMPLYPGVLSLFARGTHGVVAARVVQWFVGSLVAVCSAGIGVSLIGRRVGWLAGLLVAFDPFLSLFSSLLLTETLFLAALSALWWFVAAQMENRADRWKPSRWLVVGVLSSLCVYARESGLGLVLLLLLFLVVWSRFQGRVVLGALLVSCCIGLSLLPWALRNRSVLGAWCFLTTRGGISLYDGVRPGATGASDLGEVKAMPSVADLDEVAWDRYFMEASIRAIRADPGRLISLATVKLGRTWNPVPNAQTYRSGVVRMVSAGWSVPVFVLALIGAGCLLKRRDARVGGVAVVFLLLPAFYVTALHSIFVGSVRYRLIAMPMLEVLAAVGLMSMMGLWSRMRSASDVPDVERGQESY